MGEIVLNAEYDCILDDCYHETDLLRVGKVYAIGFGSPNGKVTIFCVNSSFLGSFDKCVVLVGGTKRKYHCALARIY